MSVTIQSYDLSPTAPTKSSAEAYPLDPYSSEDSNSTSATRNDSSSSMTAISRCPDTWNPCPELNEEAGIRNFCMQIRCSGIIQECYSLRRSDAGTADNHEVGQRFQSKRSCSVWCRRTTGLRPAFPERATLRVTPRPPPPGHLRNHQSSPHSQARHNVRKYRPRKSDRGVDWIIRTDQSTAPPCLVAHPFCQQASPTGIIR